MTEEEKSGLIAPDRMVELLSLSIDGLKERLAAEQLSFEQLVTLTAFEEAGENRKGALLAIDAAIAKTPEGKAGAAEAKRQREIAEQDAKLIRFKVGDGDSAAEAARTGKTFLVLGDGEKEIAGLERVAAEPVNFSVAGSRVMFGRAIDVIGADVKATVHAVALVDEEETVHGVCEIPGGIALGGRHVQLPAGSLIFG